MDASTKKFKQSPPKKSLIAIVPYNKRVDRSLSMIQLKGRLEAMGIDSGTVGVRGEERHAALFQRLSDAYNEEDVAEDEVRARREARSDEGACAQTNTNECLPAPFAAFFLHCSMRAATLTRKVREYSTARYFRARRRCC